MYGQTIVVTTILSDPVNTITTSFKILIQRKPKAKKKEKKKDKRKEAGSKILDIMGGKTEVLPVKSAESSATKVIETPAEKKKAEKKIETAKK